jgi:hypothetical protein
MLRLTTLSLFAAVCFSLSCQSAAAQAVPALPGTHWELLSLTGKGEKITDAQNPADVEFLKDGKWGILHYGGRREAGTYLVKGDRLVMKTDDGDIYADSKMTYKPESKILELDSGDYLMRLRYSKVQ